MSQEAHSVPPMTKNKETVMATHDREKALDAALGQIEKQFGKGSIMRMGENLHMNIESIPTGALALDMALGIGGRAPGGGGGALWSGSGGKVSPRLPAG